MTPVPARYLQRMDGIATALTDAGGSGAPRERAAQLRGLLATELQRGDAELALSRSGYPDPVCVVVTAAPAGRGLRAVLPVAPSLRADPHAIPERAWLLVAATVGALVDAGANGTLTVGRWGEHVAIELPGDHDPELAALAFDDQTVSIDRLRARALAGPPHLLEDVADLREPIGVGHPLLVARQIARQGGHPADPDSVQALEDTVLALLDTETGHGGTRPHDDPDPARRTARRILQRLAGMGKWGGYHTEFVHLARGFAPSDRHLAAATGEALVEAGLLVEKISVGQRHVFLDPGRAADIHALTDHGTVPPGLVLPGA